MTAEIAERAAMASLTPAEADVITQTVLCVQTNQFLPVISYRCRPEFGTALNKVTAALEMTPLEQLERVLRLVADGKFIAAHAYRGPNLANGLAEATGRRSPDPR